ncbi:MAG: sigma 54-interacting transcriptional regulator, partial [Bacteroidota bacterium]
EKGAFTGAFTRRVGKFEEAQGGTIFLDEIGEMDVHLQARLLRVLQEREVTRVGGNNTVKIDVRVIVATNKDLLEEVQSGRFREDLFYRLLGLPISLPPLREREDDILLLAKHFVDEFCTENQLDKITISAEARKKLAKYAWPGNVRELKAVMELAAVMSTGGTVTEEDITYTSTNHMSDFLLEETTLKQYTEKIVRHFLTRYDNNVLKVAQKLDIGKSTIYRMLKESA